MKHKKILLSLIIIASLITGILATTLLQPQQTTPIIPPNETPTTTMAKVPTISDLKQENLTFGPWALQNVTNAIAVDSYDTRFFSLSTPSYGTIYMTGALIQSHVVQPGSITEINIPSAEIFQLLNVTVSQMWNKTIGATICIVAGSSSTSKSNALKDVAQLFSSFQSRLSQTYNIIAQTNGSAYTIPFTLNGYSYTMGVQMLTTLNSSVQLYNVLNGIIPAGTFAKTIAGMSSLNHLIQIADMHVQYYQWPYYYSDDSSSLGVDAIIEGKIGQSGSSYTFSTRNLLNTPPGSNIILQGSCLINITLPIGSNITDYYPTNAIKTTTPPSVYYSSTNNLNIRDVNVTYKVLTQDGLTVCPLALQNSTDAVAVDNFNDTFFKLVIPSGQYIVGTIAFIQAHFSQQDPSPLTSIFNTMIPLKQLNVSISQMWNQSIGGAIVLISSSDPNAILDAVSNATKLFNAFQSALKTYGIIVQAVGGVYPASSSLFPGTILGVQWFTTLNSSATVYSILNGIIPDNTFAKTLAGESSPSHLIQIADKTNNMTGNFLQNSGLSVGATIEGKTGQNGSSYTFSTRNLLNTSPGSNITSQSPSSYINITLPLGCTITNYYPSTASIATTPPSISYGSSTGTLNITDVNVTYTLPPPPSVTITNPTNTTIYYGTFNVTWTSSSPYLAYYLVSIDGAPPVNVGLNTSYLVKGLSDSSHNVNVTAVNLAGVSNSSVVWFTVLYPSVIITYPSDGDWIPSGTFNVTWTSSSTNLAYYLVSIDGAPPVNVSLSTSRPVSGLPDGPHNVNVTVVNLAGLSGYSVSSFNVWSKTPSVTINYPSNDAWLPTDTFEVNWSSSSPYLAYYLVTVDNNAPENVSSTTTSRLVSGLPDGPYSVNVTVVNLAGLSNSSVKSFHVLATTPSVVITYPSDGDWLPSGTFEVTWSSSSPYLAYYLVTVDNNASINVSLATSRLVSSLPEGPHSVNVTVFNLAGLSGYSVNSLGVDIDAPTVSIISPSSGASFSDTNSVTVKWTGSDYTSDIAYYNISINNGAWISVSASNTGYTFTNLKNGDYTVEVVAFDFAGNSANASVFFSVNLPPSYLAMILLSATPQKGGLLTYFAVGGAAVAIISAAVVLRFRRRNNHINNIIPSGSSSDRPTY